jgi:hypothetical protein
MGHRKLLIAALAAAALLAAGCAGTIRARVLDARTGQPIPGAVVVGVWTEVDSFLGLSSTRLVGVREAETDAEGRMELPRLRFGWPEDEAITIYKPGYIAWSNLFVFPSSERRPSQRVPAEVLLERFPSGASRQHHIDFISGATRGGDSPETTPKFWNAVRKEQLLR